MQAAGPLAGPAGLAVFAPAPPGAAAGPGGAVSDQLAGSAAAAQGLGRVLSLLTCPVRTPACVSADEALGELKAYKLGKRKRSYNQVAVVMQHAVEVGRELPVVHSAERPGGGLPLPAGPSPALQYELRLAGGATVRAALYLVYATPLGVEATGEAARGDAGAADAAVAVPAPGALQHTWLGVSRAHCCRGCDAEVPLLAGIVRLGRGAPPPPALSGGEEAPRSARAQRVLPPAAAAEDGSPTGGGARAKDPRHLYVSLDEPSAHVAPGPGGTRRFRLLLAVWAHAAGASLAGPPGAFLGSALSQPICCVANNDVPGGAATLTLRVPLPASWAGWGAQQVPRAPSPAAAQLHGAMAPGEPRRPLQAVNAAVLSRAAAAPPRAPSATERPGTAAAALGGAAQWLVMPCGLAGGAGGLAAGAAAERRGSLSVAHQQQPPPPRQGVDALLFLGAAAADAGASPCASPPPGAAAAAKAAAKAAPVSEEEAAADQAARAAAPGPPSAEAHAAAAAADAPTPRRPRRSSGVPATVPAAAAAAATAATTPTAAQGAAALAALLAGPRANALPPTRLFQAAAEAPQGQQAQQRAEEPYVRKDHSLRALCQRFFQLFSPQEPAVSIAAAAERLGVKARRIYDVVNVLETLGMVQRQAKGTYRFCGWAALPLTLARWAHAAPEAAALAAFGAAAGAAGSANSSPATADGIPDPGAFAAIQAAARAAVAAAAAEPGADSTLAGLTQRFVTVLQASPGEGLAWDAVLTRLGATERASRRLYDVANVLCAIQLIEKPGCATYRWRGAAAVAQAFGQGGGAAAAAGNAQQGEQADDDVALARVPAELKRRRAPRSRPSALKRPRVDGEATPAADGSIDRSAPDAALAAAEDHMEAQDAPLLVAAPAHDAALAAKAGACGFGTTPSTVLAAADVLASPEPIVAIPFGVAAAT